MILVGIVKAVIIAITNPSFGNASLIVACKVPRIGTSLDRRFGRRVGRACFSVSVEFEAIWAPTFCHNADRCGVIGDGKAQFLAASIFIMARMVFCNKRTMRPISFTFGKGQLLDWGLFFKGRCGKQE